MSNLSAVARQFKLEAEAYREGVARLRSRVLQDEQRAYASGTLWGRKVINQVVVDVAARIEAKKNRLTQGKAQVGAVSVKDILEKVEPEVLAAIALKKSLDLVACPGDKMKNTYTVVCITIGGCIESEARFRWYEQANPDGWQRMKMRYFRPTTGTGQKERIASVMMNRQGFHWEKWTQKKRLAVGAFMFDCIAHTVDWFKVVEHRAGKMKTVRMVTLSDSLVNVKEQLMALAEFHAPLSWPMLCEPAPWSNENRGGYLTNELRDNHPLVRGQRGPLVLGNRPLDMLNTLQRVAYRVNPITYELMKTLEYRQMSLGKFCLQDNEVPIPRPETEDRDELFAWRKLRAEQENRNAALRGKRFRTLETLAIADRFAAEERFYIPWSFDYRGRVYPIPTFMSPQGTDMEKSLYLFADDQPLTSRAEFWLAVHVANTAGMDKLTLDDRVAWTQANHGLISAIAEDPFSNLVALESFSDPWCGLAACYEYHHCVIARTKQTTNLPVATDATCSGLQHLAGMTLDASTGYLVNVSPTPAPQDAYMAVLRRTVELLSLSHPDLAQWAEDVGRSLTKRVVMTVPYAATPHSNRGYIRQALMEFERSSKGQGRRPTSEQLTIFTKTMLKAMREVVPGPIQVMEWIKASVRDHIIETGDYHIEWMSPSGFPVRQDKRKKEIARVKTQLLGEVIRSNVVDGYKESDVNKHCSSAAPNFIHSMDAALLHNSFAGFDKPFTLIHDSILTSAADMDYMSGVIRDEFVLMYKERPLEMFAEVLGTTVPEGMIIGDLDLDHCLNSVYFFC